MWSPQRYLDEGRAKGVPEPTLNASLKQNEEFLTFHPELPSILTLNHLAKRVGIPYFQLRQVVTRKKGFKSYRHFAIRKRSGGRRIISIPSPELMKLQRWINKYILKLQHVHPCSFAFSPGSSIVKCAARHTGAKWLVKMDITNFFGSISEIQVYRVFVELGYQPLVAFELARITTCITRGRMWDKMPQWRSHKKNMAIPEYFHPVMGHLPQGAPTSPMLSNLVMKEHDGIIKNIASQYRVTYTRYSDDMSFSTRGNFSRSRALKLVAKIRNHLERGGFYLNKRKTVIVSPGARKIVLGLNVDRSVPRLPREFRDNLRQHLYYIKKLGPSIHRDKRDFESILGMKNHLYGFIQFAFMVDRGLARKMLDQFDEINWPV